MPGGRASAALVGLVVTAVTALAGGLSMSLLPASTSLAGATTSDAETAAASSTPVIGSVRAAEEGRSPRTARAAEPAPTAGSVAAADSPAATSSTPADDSAPTAGSSSSATGSPSADGSLPAAVGGAAAGFDTTPVAGAAAVPDAGGAGETADADAAAPVTPAGAWPAGGSQDGAPGGGPSDPGAVYTGLYTLPSGRTYYLHTTVQPGKPRPLVVLLHALAHDAARMQEISNATAFADEHDFAVAYGVAVDGAWNAGTCCATNPQDDMAYLRQLVADASRRTPVDPERVYVWGFSNGGMMAARAVCEAPDLFAAAGVVAGHLLVPCDDAAVRMMHIHGVNDRTVPWQGGWSDYVHVYFPDARTESLRVTTSSTLVGVPWDGGHDWPWWATGALWEFSHQADDAG